LNKEDRFKIERKYYKTKTNIEIAKMCNCYRQTVVRDLKELKLSRRESLKLKKNEKFYSLKKLGFSNYYVSNYGRVCNKNKIIIKPSLTPDGYYGIKMVNDKGKRETKRLNRIIALRLIPNPDNKNEVNHINGNKLDNSVNNLEWVTTKENNLHAVKNKLNTKKLIPKEIRERVCFLLSKNHSTKEILDILQNEFNYKNSNFNINGNWINKIKNKKLYKNISDKYF